MLSSSCQISFKEMKRLTWVWLKTSNLIFFSFSRKSFIIVFKHFACAYVIMFMAKEFYCQSLFVFLLFYFLYLNMWKSLHMFLLFSFETGFVVSEATTGCFSEAILKNFATITGKHQCQSFFSIHLQASACNFIIKRLRHRCFPVNFLKFLRTTF